MSLVPNIDTEARAKAQAAFPVGASVRQAQGGLPGVVIGHTSKGAVVIERGGLLGGAFIKPEHLEVAK